MGDIYVASVAPDTLIGDLAMAYSNPPLGGDGLLKDSLMALTAGRESPSGQGRSMPAQV